MIVPLLALMGTVVVQPAGPVKSIAHGLALARPGDTVLVRAGTYQEPALVISRPVTLLGDGAAILLGGEHSTLEIRADDVVVRGLVFSGVTPSGIEDRAAILVNGGNRCRIEANRVTGAFFGIYLKQTAGCRVARNRVSGLQRGVPSSGNGIQLWRSREAVLDSNIVVGQRDGIYFEFVAQAVVRDNQVSRNQRYGLHFMRSDSCLYERNRFFANGAGVAVMYSRGVRMLANRFERNWGPAAYGLLLKEINDAEVRGNRFDRNTVGLYLDDANRNLVRANQFSANGWAVKLLASASDNRFEANSFAGNSFDVATNSRSATSVFRENWWDHYRGYDLDGDGFGDVPFRPVRLFALVVEQSNPAILLLRSAFVDLLDGAERLLPILTPEALADPRPRMRQP